MPMPTPTWNDPPIDPRYAKQKRRTRIVLIWFWSVVGVVTVLAVIGSFIPEEEQAAPTATEQRPTTTTALTTIRQPTTTVLEVAISAALQEIFADLTEQDCAEEVIGYGDNALAMADTLAAMLADIDAGRLIEAEWDYWQLWGQKTMALDDYALWMEVCAPKSSPALVAEVESFTPIVQEAWNDLERACHAELKAHGWDCSPAN